MSSEAHKHARAIRLVEVFEKFIEAKVQEMLSRGDGTQEYITLEDWRKELLATLYIYDARQ